jgi:hypothetical protein
MDELQEMREQMAALKEKLNKQEIVSEQLMLQIVGKKIKREIVAAWLLAVLVSGLFIAAWLLSFCMLESIEWRSLIFDTAITTLLLITVIKSLSIIKMKDVRAGKLMDVFKQMKRAQEYENGRGRWWRLALLLVLLGHFVSKNIVAPDIVDICLIVIILVSVLVRLIRGKIRTKKGKTFYRSAWDNEIEQIEEIIRLNEEEEPEN